MLQFTQLGRGIDGIQTQICQSAKFLLLSLDRVVVLTIKKKHGFSFLSPEAEIEPIVYFLAVNFTLEQGLLPLLLKVQIWGVASSKQIPTCPLCHA